MRRLAQSRLGDFVFPKALLILDGTYIYIEKSNNFQRRSSSPVRTQGGGGVFKWRLCPPYPQCVVKGH